MASTTAKGSSSGQTANITRVVTSSVKTERINREPQGPIPPQPPPEPGRQAITMGQPQMDGMERPARVTSIVNSTVVGGIGAIAPDQNGRRAFGRHVVTMRTVSGPCEFARIERSGGRPTASSPLVPLKWSIGGGMRLSKAILFLLALVAWTISSEARAAEGYDNCAGFIDSLPATITTQGTWCMRRDLSTAITSGHAITIATNNVTIDCNDFKLGGLAAGSATYAFGIYGAGIFNATVRHCSIRGFQSGLFLSRNAAGGGHVIEDNRFEGNTRLGIFVDGDGSIIRRNLILNTGGSTSEPGTATAITVITAVDVLDNTIDGVAALPSSGGFSNPIGIQSGVIAGSISGNRLRAIASPGYGIQVAFGNHQTLRGNIIESAGIFGLYCFDATSVAIDNVISTSATGILGCSDAGGNVLN